MVKGAETHFKPVLLAVQAGLGAGDLCISSSGLNPEWFTLYPRSCCGGNDKSTLGLLRTSRTMLMGGFCGGSA